MDLYSGPIDSLADARQWLHHAVFTLGLNFHWDTHASEYEDMATGEATFTDAEVDVFEDQLLRAMDAMYEAKLDPYAEATGELNACLKSI